jgi:23S rRNA (cytosine1962-C5)-methyltransferase
MLAAMTPEDAGYALLDAGDGRRLERFGGRVVDRPAPAAVEPRRDFLAWRSSDLRFDAGRGWTERGEPVEAAAVGPWTVVVDGLTMELRPTASGGLGLYPEHAANLAWVAARVASRAGPGAPPPSVLNLFAHTGLVTVAAARAGAAVTHVDAARAAVAWARRNAELSGLADRPIRWIVDDAAGFVAREARRGRRYDGIILDPPSFGRAGRRQWRLVDELPSLLAACRLVATDGAFVLLTAHTAGLGGDELVGALSDAFPGARGDVEPLTIEAASGASLDLGWAIRHQP